VGETKSMFFSYKFDITSVIAASNTLEIRLSSVLDYARDKFE